MVIGKRDANTIELVSDACVKKAKLQDICKYGVERMRDAL
jgi:hypothetical protein